MHEFTRPAPRLRLVVRDALLRSLHYFSLYRRLIIAVKEKGARINVVNRAIHTRLISNPKEGTTLLKFIYGQFYNGKLAQRYGHAPPDECPLCHNHDACTHIAGECQDYKALRINRHNGAYHLVHAAIRRTVKGGGFLHTEPELILIAAADMGSQPHATEETLELLSPSFESTLSTHEEADSAPRDANPLLD